MRYLVVVKKNGTTVAGGCNASPELVAAMLKYNEELARAGVLEACEGLQPIAKGARVSFSGEQRAVVDGPFAETKELIAGFWIWQCRSLEEAIEWARKCPGKPGGDDALEIRPILEPAEFPLSTRRAA